MDDFNLDRNLPPIEAPLPGSAPEGPSPTAKPALRFKMFAEIKAQPRKLYIVDGLLGEGEMSAFAGAPSSGKSVLAGDLACHIGAGMDWIGRRVRRRLGVLYIAAERASLTERRLAAWRRRYEIDELPLAVIAGHVDFLHNRNHVTEVLAYGKRLTEATGVPLGLIIVDTVSRTLAGGDENGPKDMGAYVANVAALQDASGAHVLLLHHVPQGGDARLRGHGALLGAVDTMITIEKSNASRIATVAKDNDGVEGATLAFTLDSVELSVDEEGLVTTAPVVAPIGSPVIAQASVTPTRNKEPTKADNLRRAFVDAYTNLAEEVKPSPGLNAAPVRKVRESAIRDALRDRGYLKTDDARNLTSTARGNFHDTKTSLFARNAFVQKGGLVWQIKPFTANG
jgi:hypothetical protein